MRPGFVDVFPRSHQRNKSGVTPLVQTRLWGEAQKPEALADASLEDFFAVECEALPHFVYQKDEWSAKVQEVGSRCVIN